MEGFINSVLNLDAIWYWGIGLMLLFPIVVLLLNEVNYKVQKKDKELAKPLYTFRNYIVPLIVLAVLLIKVLDFSRDGLSIKVLETIIWVLVINASISFVNNFFFKGNGGGSWRGNVPQLFLDIFRVFFVLFGGAVVLSSVWGIELGGLATALGLGSFVLGLALQDTLGNLFSGIALVYEKPFKVGDWIKVEEVFGEVIEMNWRAVRIRTREGELLVMPHLMIGQGLITNYSMPTRVHVIKTYVSFSYADPPNKVKEALMRTCVDTPGVLNVPEPEIKTDEYGDSSIRYEIEFAIEDFAYHEEITDEVKTRIWYTAMRHQLTIPYPQLTLHQAPKQKSVVESQNELLKNSLKFLPEYLAIEKENTDELLNGSKVDYFAANEIIISQGEASGKLYVIIEGSAELFVRNREGEEIFINALSKGDFFGEVALFTSRTNSMTVKAKSDCKVIAILPQEVIDMVGRNPRLASQLDEAMDTRRQVLSNLDVSSK